MIKSAGVYKIVNVLTEQVYYGSSKNIRKRHNEHFARLRAGKHANQKLQRSFNKYGKDFFIFEIVELCENFVDREQFYLDNLKPYFNISTRANIVCAPRTKEWATKIAMANTGRKISEETRERLRVSHLGKIPGNKGLPCSDEKKAKISASKIGTPPWNKGIKTGRNEKQIAAVTGRKKSEKTKLKLRKPVSQIDIITGLVIKEWGSGKEAGKELGIQPGNIAGCCTGKIKSKKAGGFIWQREIL